MIFIDRPAPGPMSMERVMAMVGPPGGMMTSA